MSEDCSTCFNCTLVLTCCSLLSCSTAGPLFLLLPSPLLPWLLLLLVCSCELIRLHQAGDRRLGFLEGGQEQLCPAAPEKCTHLNAHILSGSQRQRYSKGGVEGGQEQLCPAGHWSHWPDWSQCTHCGANSRECKQICIGSVAWTGRAPPCRIHAMVSTAGDALIHP
jgi:hypothetical protein